MEEYLVDSILYLCCLMVPVIVAYNRKKKVCAGTRKNFSSEQYLRDIEGNDTFSCNKNRCSRAFNFAVDSRKFEIELYWKRATYFWAFILVCFTSIGLTNQFPYSEMIRFLISCLGFFVTVAFWMINRGSKFWQENWEAHVDLLGETFIGPLYRYVIVSDKAKMYSIGSPWTFSVSRVNMYVSFILIIFWLILILWQITMADEAVIWNMVSSFIADPKISDKWIPPDLPCHMSHLLTCTRTYMRIIFLFFLITAFHMFLYCETSEISLKIRSNKIEVQKENEIVEKDVSNRILIPREKWWENDELHK